MLIVEFWTDGTLLADAFERAPEMVVSPEEGYIANESAHYIFWAEGDDFAEFEAGLRIDPAVADQQVLTDAGPRRLYRIQSPEDEHENTLPAWRDLGLVLIDAEGTRDGWTFRMQFPDREALSDYRSIHHDHGLAFEVLKIFHDRHALNAGAAQLTDPQREALVAAYEAGYFEVPQESSQADVAAQMEISPQALSERLQRGTRAMIEAELVDP